MININLEPLVSQEFSLKMSTLHTSLSFSTHVEDTESEATDIKYVRKPIFKVVHSIKKEGPFVCNLNNCKKIYNKKWLFERHLNAHYDKRDKYFCYLPGCDKSYKSRENLNIHFINIHNNIKPFQCKYCAARFSHRNGKLYHERKYHRNLLDFKCEFESKYLPFI